MTDKSTTPVPAASDRMTAERLEQIRRIARQSTRAVTIEAMEQLDIAIDDLLALVDKQNARVIAAEARLAEMRGALEKSVELQSHYATILNGYDGGRRLRFKSADEWLVRLAALSSPAPSEARLAERTEPVVDHIGDADDMAVRLRHFDVGDPNTWPDDIDLIFNEAADLIESQASALAEAKNDFATVNKALNEIAATEGTGHLADIIVNARAEIIRRKAPSHG